MSRRNPDDQERVSLEVPCDYCGAKPGSWCGSKGGGWTAYLHGNRVWPYVQGWGAGYQEAQDDHLQMIRGYSPQQLLDYQQRVLAGKRW